MITARWSGVRVMAPLEIRPVGAGELAAGGRRPAGPARTAAAGARFDYALNPDRAWTPPPEEIRRELARVVARLQALRARPAEVREADRTRTELFSLGVFAAARWTLGYTGDRPMDLVPARVCDAEVAGQLTRAREVFDAGGDGWAQAFGVWTWLQWLTGGVEELTYPEERHPHLAALVWPGGQPPGGQ